MSILSGVNSVNLTLGASDSVTIGIEKTMIATAIATAELLQLSLSKATIKMTACGINENRVFLISLAFRMSF